MAREEPKREGRRRGTNMKEEMLTLGEDEEKARVKATNATNRGRRRRRGCERREGTAMDAS